MPFRCLVLFNHNEAKDRATVEASKRQFLYEPSDQFVNIMTFERLIKFLFVDMF
jgi:hypothetical protein